MSAAQQAIVPLRIHRELDELWCSAPDVAGTARLGKRLLAAHLICMALFITVILAIPAWLFAAANILASPKVLTWVIRCGPGGLELRSVATRGELVAADGPEAKSAGPYPLGLGTPPPSRRWAWEELRAVRWDEVGIRLELEDGQVEKVDLERTSREDIARLGQELEAARAVWATPVSQAERAEGEAFARSMRSAARRSPQ